MDGTTTNTDTATPFSFGTTAKKRDLSETATESHQSPSFAFTFSSAPTEHTSTIFNFSPSPNIEDTKSSTATPPDFWDDNDDGEWIISPLAEIHFFTFIFT